MPSRELEDCSLQPEVLTEQELSNFALIAGFSPMQGRLTPELREFALIVMEKCAGIGDKYTDGRNKGNAGDEIRAMFGIADDWPERAY